MFSTTLSLLLWAILLFVRKHSIHEFIFQAVHLLASAGEWRVACDILVQHKVTLTDELADVLTPPKENEMKDNEEKGMGEYKANCEDGRMERRQCQRSSLNTIMRKEILLAIASMAKKQESIM